MLIERIGEFGLIESFRKKIKTDPALVIKGSGDDCAVLKFDKNHYQLYTCDMLVEDVDFTSEDDPYLVGRKAIAVSVSDIASSSGLPQFCIISLGLPKNTTVEYIERLAKGMLKVASDYKINIVGGDISRCRQLVIDVSMLGLVEKKTLTLRSGACVGDLIFVTGALGGSIKGRHLNFKPAIKESQFLAKNFKVNAMIDISDGLAQDLSHILKESNTGAIIYENLIPVHKDARGLDEALYMGEDFELLFTLDYKEAGRLLNDKKNKFKLIGEIVNKKYGLKIADAKNNEKPLKIKGFSHF